MRKGQAAALVLCLLAAGAGSLLAFHDGDHGEGPLDTTFKVGKTGEVNIEMDVRIGTNLVKRGKYMLTHRAEGQRHVFVLAEVNKKKQPSQLAMYEIDSRFVANPQPVKNSTLMVKEQKDHSVEVLRIQIAGENGDHDFPANAGGNNANPSKN